jgi:predicted metalloprotease with PDZ domain
MISKMRGAAMLFLLLLALATARPSQAKISYTISLDHPGDHLFHVTMTVPVEGRELDTSLPAWNALYQIRDFAERIRDVTAICPSLEAVPLRVQKVDKQNWKIVLPGKCDLGDHNTFIIRYAILWDEAGPFDSQLNAHHAFLNLAEILMFSPTRRNEETTVRFTDLSPGWQTGSALKLTGDLNSYSAPTYDALVDAPVEIGAFDGAHFESGGATIGIILEGKDSGLVRLENYVHKITDYELQLMGGPPFDPRPGQPSYLFVFHIGPAAEVGGGGMEHRNSTAIAAGTVEEAAATAAHEFFHSWNVKRIRPQSLEPVDYSREQYTRSLWFAEGVTSAYASYTLERTGLWTKDQFYKDLAEQIATLQSRPAHVWQSAEESSLDAWFEGFPDYADPARSISYYNKGQILGVMLDLAIRDATDGRKSLDDVMRRMNQEYAEQGKFYDDSEGVRRVVEEVSGKDFKDFFSRYVSGTEEIPYNNFLNVAGLALNPDPNANSSQRFTISEVPHPTDRQRRIRESLLRGSSD